jgi:hypothetical protein
MIDKIKPVFEKRIFWDVNFEQMTMMPKPTLLLSGFLNVAMLRIFVSAAGIMAMKK